MQTNKEQAWNGNMIDLLTDHRSLHQWLYIRCVNILSQAECTSGVSQQQLAELAIAATDVGIYGLLASQSC